MTESHEDDVRRMLRRRAADVTPSPDAWDAIAARLSEEGAGATVVPLHRPGRHRRVIAGAAVAAIAATGLGGAALLGSAGSGPALVAVAPDDPAALEATGLAEGTTIPAVWPRPTAEALTELAATEAALADPVATARAYLADRLAVGPGVELGAYQAGDARSGSVPYTTGGGAGGEVLVARLGDEGSPWYVVAAVTDQLVFDPVVEDGRTSLRVTAEAAGTVSHEVTAPDGEVLLSGSAPIEPSGTLTLGRLDREGPITAQVRLEGDEGALLAHLEVWAEPNPVGPGDPADPGFAGVWPETDGPALAEREAEAAAGRAEAPDPEDLAAAFLEDELGLVGVTTGDLVTVGPLEGQVSYQAGDGAAGVVTVARTGDEDDRLWFVTGVTSERLEVVAVRPEGATLVVDVAAAAPGRLTGVAGVPDGTDVESAPQQLERPLTTSVGFPGITGPSVVVLRLAGDDGTTSVAVLRA